ncbi:MAG: 6-bladed beta-propeller [Candidatus Krumholzibacteriia bacterium]
MRALRSDDIFERICSRKVGTFLRLALAALVAVSTGCARRDVVRRAVPPPEFIYPGHLEGPNLQLVSLLADPHADRFAQGMPVDGLPVPGDGFVRTTAAVFATDGALYVLDGGRGAVFRSRYDGEGGLADARRFDLDGRPFPSALDMAIHPDGACWVVDSKLAGVYRLDGEGRLLSRFEDGLSRPVGIAYHAGAGRMLVTDLAANRIYEMDAGGNVVASHGPGQGLQLEAPSFIAVGPGGNIFVVEALGARVKVIDPQWAVLRTFGGTGDGPGHFARPKGIAVDSGGRVYVVDALFDNVQIFDREGTLLLTLGTTGQGVAEFWQPMGISIDGRQRIFVADSFNRRIQVFRWTERG